jgi:hypothetical protein
MTFGEFKSYIEKKLIESYKNEKEFKKILREFKYSVLNDKTISKIFSLYDQISSPQGLNEEEAKEYLEEGVDLLFRLLPSVKLAKSLNENVKNNYQDVDVLVYNNKININERLESRKKLVSILMQPKNTVQESINIPIQTMVNVANQTIKNYIENIDENSKKEILELLKEDSKSLEEKFEKLKDEGIQKLNTLLEEEKDFEIKEKINETIDKLKSENFDQINFVRIKNLVNSI